MNNPSANQSQDGNVLGANSPAGMIYWSSNSTYTPDGGQHFYPVSPEYFTNTNNSTQFSSNYTNVAGPGPNIGQIVLDTTGGLGNATVYWLLDGTIGAVQTGLNLTGSNAVTEAAIGTYEAAQGTFQNFSLADGAYWTGPVAQLAAWRVGPTTRRPSPAASAIIPAGPAVIFPPTPERPPRSAHRSARPIRRSRWTAARPSASWCSPIPLSIPAAAPAIKATTRSPKEAWAR